MQKISRKQRRSHLAIFSSIESLENRRLFSGYTLTNLGFFTDGGQPAEGLIADSAGNLYGLTQAGGTNGTGSVYEVAIGSTKPAVLASFHPTTTGSLYPNSLVLDATGNLFGTTDRGGTNGTGSVFEVVKGSNAITTLANFDADASANSSGAYPEGNIVIDPAGNLFGTAVDGGQVLGATGGGTYWELSKASNTITPLAVFPTLNTTGTLYPSRANFFTRDSAGNVYGIAEGNQQHGYYGYVWEIPVNTSTVNTLATFENTDGADPLGAVAIDSSGNLFGTTVYGGTGQGNSGNLGAGVVWEVRAHSSAITDLASFSPASGYSPDGVTIDGHGNLFGTANYGGAANPASGTVWELPAGASTITSLASFGATGAGQLPDGGVLIDSTGNLFGTTFQAGGPRGSGNGSVFELIAPGNTVPTGTATLAPVVTKTSLPPAIIPGASTHGTATVDVSNQGPAVKNGSVIVSVYASLNGVIDSNSALLGTVNRDLHIKSGHKAPVVVNIKSIPASLSGNYKLLAQTAETNGVTASAVAGPSTNITAAFISFEVSVVKTTLGSSAISGQTSKATAQIKITNKGNILSKGSTTIALYASADGTATNGTLIRSYPTSVVLKSGASKMITIALKAIPAVTNGNYFLVAQAIDPLGNVTSGTSVAKVTLAMPFAALVPTIVSTTVPKSSTSGAKSQAAVSLTIINNGNTAPTSAGAISVYASGDGTVRGGTLLTTSVLKTTIKPGKSAKMKLALTKFALLSPGAYYLVVQVTGQFNTSPAAVSATSYAVT